MNYFFTNLDCEPILRFCEVRRKGPARAVAHARTCAPPTRRASAAAQACLECTGVVIFCGVGKSGFVAQKICQTLVSTGTKAMFLNPTGARE